jgi:nitrate reductase gamma subunit
VDRLPLTVLELFSYVVLTIFSVVLLSRAVRWASMPMHLRWELYPVAHEPNNYGGSYMEEADWWTKRRRITRIGMLKELLLEMVFIKKVFVHKRKLWYATYAFHAGIYLILVWFALLFVSGVAIFYGRMSIPSALPFSQLLYYSTLATGCIGMVATTVGGIALIILRVKDDGMRQYSVPADYFNLTFVVAASLLGVFSWVMYDPTLGMARLFMTSLISLGEFEGPHLNRVIEFQIAVVGLLFMYIPFTKMTHFIGKYFTYHMVLWDDAPNIRGSKLEKKVKENLGHRISWSAPHLKAGRTWAEEATQPSSLKTKKVWDENDS